MADDHRNAHHPTDQVGEVSTTIQPALDEQLANLKQLLETNPEPSSTQAALLDPYGDAFPPSDTFGGPLGLNNLIDNIWDSRRKQKRPSDPLLRLKGDVMEEVLLYVVNLWDIAESIARGTEIIPRNSIGDPLVLMNVSRGWSEFIPSFPPLWSHLLIETDDEDALERLQLFLQQSRNRKLFIILHGRAVVCDAIVAELLRVGDRIGALVYPPSVSRPTLARFGFCLRAPHNRWYELEVQSPMRRRKYMGRYPFPTSIQSLWMNGLFLPSNLVTLSDFQSLSSLSVRIRFDRDLPPSTHYEVELPNLERLTVQMALTSKRQVDTPNIMICRNLKLLALRYTLELDLENLPDGSVTPMEFGVIDALEHLQVDLAIHEVNTVGSIDPLVNGLQRLPQLQQGQGDQDQDQDQQYLEQRRLEQQQRQLEQVEQRSLARERRRSLEREEQMEQLEQLDHQALEQGMLDQGEQEWVLEERKWQQQQLEQQLEQQRKQQREFPLLHMHLVVTTQQRLQQWIGLPNDRNYVQHSSLKVTLSTRMHQEACILIRNTIEEDLVLRLPQLTELTTSNILHIFPPHLQKLCLHGFGMPRSLPSIELPRLVSLEIMADGLDHLLIMRHIRVPQLRDLRVQVEDGPGELHYYDWHDTTSNPVDHLSLRINIPRHKQGNSALIFFQLPQTHTLNISSPHMPLCLFLPEIVPISYTLHADLEAMSSPPPVHTPNRISTISAKWREALITEWINPLYGVPCLAKFRTLVSLRRTVLDQRPYLPSKQSPTDEFFKLLAENIDICPHLTSIAVSQCPSSWLSFMCHLRRRNREALLSESTECIEELTFYQPLHDTIIKWLMDAIRAKALNVIEQPPVRQGKGWPMRPVKEDKQVFRSCYICHITGMELGCQEYETRNVDCARERCNGSNIYAH